MEHIMLTLFLCFVAFAAVGQATYICPRRAGSEKLYAPPMKTPQAAPSSNNADVNLPLLVMISGGLEENTKQMDEGEGIRRAA